MRFATISAIVVVVVFALVVDAHEVHAGETDVHTHHVRRLHRATLTRAIKLRNRLKQLQREGRGHEFARVPENFLQMGASVRQETRFLGSLISVSVGIALLDKIIVGLVSGAFKMTTNVVIGVVTYEGMETVNKIAIQKFMLLIFQLAVVVVESLIEFNPLTLISAIPVIALYGVELIITMRIGLFIKKGLDTITSTCVDLEPLRIDAVDSRYKLAGLQGELETLEMRQEALKQKVTMSATTGGGSDDEEEERRLDEMHNELLDSVKSMQKIADEAAQKYKELSSKILRALSEWKNKAHDSVDYREYRIFSPKYNIVFWILDWMYRLGQKVNQWFLYGWQKATGAAKEQLRETRARAKLPVSAQLRPEEEFFKQHNDVMKLYIDQVTKALKQDQLLESDNAMEGIPTEFVGHVYDTAWSNRADLAYVYADKDMITVGRTAFNIDIDEAQNALEIGNRADAMHNNPKIKNSLLLRCALRMNIPLAVMLKKASMKFRETVRHRVGKFKKRQCNYLLQNAFNINLEQEGDRQVYKVSVAERKAKYCISWGYWRSKKKFDQYRCNIPWKKEHKGFSWCVDSAQEVVSWTCALITALEYTKDPTLLSTTFLSTRPNSGIPYGSSNVFQQAYIPVKEVYEVLCKKPDEVSTVITSDLVGEAQDLKARLEELKKKKKRMSMIPPRSDMADVDDLSEEDRQALEKLEEDDRKTLEELEANEFDPLENVVGSLVRGEMLSAARKIVSKENAGKEATKTAVPSILPDNRNSQGEPMPLAPIREMDEAGEDQGSAGDAKPKVEKLGPVSEDKVSEVRPASPVSRER